MRRVLLAAATAVLLLLTGAWAGAAHPQRGDWGAAVDVEAAVPGAHEDLNTPALEGCPFIAKDGKTLFLASNREGGLGGLDIWIATRASTSHPWGEPVNAGAPINSAANDFCPTLAADGHSFFFVSARAGHCGTAPNADIYLARWNADGTFTEPAHLGCEVNSAWDEHSPFPTNLRGSGPVLFYSSARPAHPGDLTTDHDLYQSRQLRAGQWGQGEQVPGLNTPWTEGQPNVSRDGLELYFHSDRPGTLGLSDIYVSTRHHVRAAWGEPVNLGPAVNSPAAESRPSLSWDMRTLYFGSARVGGQSDIYVSVR